MERRELFHVLSATAAAAQTTPYAPRFLSANEWASVERLALALLPEEPGSPGARSGEVPRYVDTILLYADAATQAEWRRGLAILKPEDFARVAAAELEPGTEAERFFVTFKRLALEAFFQSPAGAAFFQYKGNTSIATFPGCPAGPATNRTSHRH